VSIDKSKKIDRDVKEIHTHIKKSNLVLRQKMKDLQVEMEEWQGGMFDGESEGFMH
jgi:hypothetical protein